MINNTNKKKNYSNSNNAGGTSASRPLVSKLNLHTIMYTIGVLLTVNAILCIGIFSYELWETEKNAINIIDEIGPRSENVLGYSFSSYEENSSGLKFWNVFNDLASEKNESIYRQLFFDAESGHPLSSLKYQLSFEKENISVTYPVGLDLRLHLKFLIALLAFESIIIIFGINKGARKIRKVMWPLSDMTKQTQKLNSSPSKGLTPEEIKRVRELAGTISNIDVTKLDKRLSLDVSQTDLRDLANAINSMLNRIDESYRSQVRFVSDASHELRTPISVIQGYVNLLDRWGKNDEATLQESIDAIKSEADNMKDLIEQLLFLARGDNETMKLDLEDFDCSDMIEEILKETQMIDSRHSFRLKSTTNVIINADRQLMKQALRILIDNSIKYTPDQGEIVVGVSAEYGMARISVQDNGIGIDPENLPYIFDRFYRSDESRARKTGGSGLGLSIMKWIIDRHKGSVEVVSRKDIGTRTTIVIPAVVKTETNF